MSGIFIKFILNNLCLYCPINLHCIWNTHILSLSSILNRGTKSNVKKHINSISFIEFSCDVRKIQSVIFSVLARLRSCFSFVLYKFGWNFCIFVITHIVVARTWYFALYPVYYWVIHYIFCRYVHISQIKGNYIFRALCLSNILLFVLFV